MSPEKNTAHIPEYLEPYINTKPIFYHQKQILTNYIHIISNVCVTHECIKSRSIRTFALGVIRMQMPQC